MDTLAKRLKIARTHLGYTQDEIANLIGGKRRGYQANESGNSDPRSDVITAFVSLGINANWLLTGEGQMLINDDSGFQQAETHLSPCVASEDNDQIDLPKHLKDKLQSLSHKQKMLWEELLSDLFKVGKATESDLDALLSQISSQAPSITDERFNEEFVLVPGYHIQVSTGNGACFQGEEVKRHLAFRRKYLKYRQSNPDLLAVVFSKGDSMEPTIKDNDSLLIDLGCTEPKDGKIFVVRFGDDLYAKRIQQLISGGLVLISDNKEYREQIISPDEVNQLQVIGQVIWIGKDV
ncbi:S24 family peptidase [Photobacterium nomapromontoriensis]|uniref:S24 family peptidase n=1 Tax=Photobacterium nomapromontoriensis TaxID=2910237 RepID=UPI003D0B5365